MKKHIFMIASILLLSSCGDTSLVDSIAAEQTGNAETIVIPEMTKVTEKTDENIVYASETIITIPDEEDIPLSEDETTAAYEDNTVNTVEISVTDKPSLSEGETNPETENDNDTDKCSSDTIDNDNEKYPEIDLDLTEYDGNMVYATVYDMMFNGDQYLGQVIKVRGIFGYYKDEDTGDEFFGVVISDATACCSQGIEFVLDGEYTYPDDYPKLGTDITVTGVFDYYTEGHGIYLQLLHADMKINTNDEDDQ